MTAASIRPSVAMLSSHSPSAPSDANPSIARSASRHAAEEQAEGAARRR